ncbi:glycosyltransferase family 4 protein [Corynebacterium epidermidicanis]|uniref:Glycosyltransferase n=1 Tax=Corynebacterium epidermidicanis TaxID=1050174 RepID=A0A0G3GQ02_9CORY|nr:glycosyltransferase family 4 protein [Corynebacterium epidermidicanis]AKK03286.1 glycosyltransferase [Corynebacterium epidermidicanis]
MRIGLVCPYSFDEPGGVQAHILDLARYLLGQGHEVRVIGPATDAATLPDFVVPGGASFAVPYNGSVARLAVGPRVTRLLRRFIDDGRFDILHIHEPNAPSFSMQALRIAEGAIVATYHASATESRLLKLATPGLRPMLEKIRGGIAVSEMARRWQVENLGGDPVLIPNGVDTGAFRADPRPVRKAKPQVVFLGRTDEPRKGLDVLCQARQLMKHECEFVVVGSGQPRPDCEATFLGRVDDAEKIRVLQQSDIYVAPNLGGESFGIVLVEAMAAGCAVVASDLEAFRDVLASNSEQPAGRVFRTGDPLALARVLDELLADPTAVASLQAAGQLRCRRFDWEVVGQEILRVYDAVADGQPVTAKGRA